ncbi:MAG: DUF1499 domain-containing protein [Alphaproteobacteria bacterium]|nr:DUF1499 domain-containing protein [Alphaproteobacteria bacterium]
MRLRALFAGPLALFAGLVLAGCRGDLDVGLIEPVAFDRLTLTTGSTLRYLVCPRDFCERTQPHRISPSFDVAAERLRYEWEKVLIPYWNVSIFAENRTLNQVDYVRRSLILETPDVVTVRFLPLDRERSTLAIYSRSLYGLTDFGVNRRRTEAWLAALDAAMRQIESPATAPAAAGER